MNTFGCCALLWGVLAMASSISAQAPPVSAAALLEQLNDERAARGLRALVAAEPLARYALDRATQISREGGVEAARRPRSTERLRRLQEQGYEAYEVTELLAQIPGREPAQVLRDWRQRGAEGFAELLRDDLRDVGVAAVPAPGAPIYVVLLALDWPTHFAERTSTLADLDAVRVAHLDRVNRERRARRAPPLRADRRLDRAAQLYAERMMREGFYAHVGPAGDTVLDRARNAVYDVSAVAENLALGPYSIDQAVDGWLESPGHRRNLLDPQFRDVGLGVALGRHASEGKLQVIWVQVFGAPR